jgi:hypothetical protein
MPYSLQTIHIKKTPLKEGGFLLDVKKNSI